MLNDDHIEAPVPGIEESRSEMTTAAAVAGRALSRWSRETRWGTWYVLCPEPADAPPLGGLRVDRALLASDGARDRLASAVLAVARLRLPGVPRTVDLVAQAGEIWLITTRPPVPTVADVLAAAGPRPDAGSVASVLNETAQTLLALHAAGLAHGSLTADGVVLAPDGTALLAEPVLATVLGDAVPVASALRADIAAWAALARTLGNAWAASGTPAADLFARCAATAESDGLGAARAVLAAGRAVLPADFLRRTALRAAAAAALPDTSPPPTASARPTPSTPSTPLTSSAPPSPSTPPSPPDAAPAVKDTTGQVTAVPYAGAEVRGRDGDAERASGADAQFPVPRDELTVPRRDELTVPGRRDRVDHRATPDEQATVLGRQRTAPDEHPTVLGGHHAASDEQVTVLGRRRRPSDAYRGPDTEGGGDDDIVLRFGPGVPADGQESLRALWRDAAPAPARRRRAWVAATVGLTALAVVVWLALLRPTAGPSVTAAEVQAPTRQLSCGETADVIGVMTTDGRGGPVTYRWLRGDGHDSGELVRTARRGERSLTVHLRWTVRGSGRFRGTARLQVLHPSGADGESAPIEAEGGFRYSCP